ncbi:unnamed protein product [Rotaria socialis]|uniref:Tr-type G domain-containing protein n=1 Tax=Rotaria socialis TaxID=392032 RepID=A0A819WDJ8_9BILA|nr:unnamed protein product [Rotaria socialis]CAF3337103.1 unnamed protein product [Rotaria socialis]CAF3520288.1 unnamed protein product [Rotaria socialis]CAF3772296.1 unnamed protein product [Rotaria socialis]CAF4121277.1 unnamed protein product [Rotaria socialis]
MSNQDPTSTNNRRTESNFNKINQHVTSLFGSTDDEDEDDNEQVPRSPFVLTGLPPEPQEGNIEYKLKLIDPNPYRLEHLITQMNWRLQEGQGEALYEIGVEDCGTLSGVSSEELEASLTTLKTMADRLGASITILHERTLKNDRHIVEVLIRKVPDDQHFIDLRVAVLGTVDSGKSSVVGVCTHGELDNGRGRARLNLFRHLHEIQSGRTSSITHEILGFNNLGESIDYGCCRTANEICNRSTKIITFIDLAGHKKYMKTTLFGLAAHAADFAMLCVDAPSSVVDTTREHFSYARTLDVPVFVVINKIDLCSKTNIQQTITCLTYLLKHGIGSTQLRPYVVQREEDLVKAADMFVEKSICPIFAVSCVTGENIDLLKKFLNILPPRLSTKDQERLSSLPVEYRIDEIYRNNVSGAAVVCGTLKSGSIREGENYLVGPLVDGKFLPVQVTTIQRYRVPRRIVRSGQAASLSLLHIGGSRLRKGMVLISSTSSPEACFEFVAEIYLSMHHTNTPIRKGFETTVQIESIRQTVLIIEMDKEELHANKQAIVTFRFRNRCEYVLEGSRLIFRSGQQTKGSGRVIKVLRQIQE